MDTRVVFPLTIRFENGEVESFEDVEDIELNLEEFDSDLDTDCQVWDKLGRPVRLKVKLLNMEELSLISI